MFNILLYGTGIITTSKIIKNKQLNRMYLNNNVKKPPLSVSIILPTLNEEYFIETTLQSIHNQNVIQKYPECFEIILIDSNSDDKTVDISKKYVDKIILCEKGKLNARHIATEYSSGDVIVAVDADTYYPPNWLNEMLKYYNNKKVVAVAGNRYFIKSDDAYYQTIYDIYMSMLRPMHNRICGGNSSYLKDIYYFTEGFNLDINQQDIKEMVNEEELLFYKKLSKFGTVVKTSSILVLTSDRHLIRVNGECTVNDSYCEQVISNERF